MVALCLTLLTTCLWFLSAAAVHAATRLMIYYNWWQQLGQHYLEGHSQEKLRKAERVQEEIPRKVIQFRGMVQTAKLKTLVAKDAHGHWEPLRLRVRTLGVFGSSCPGCGGREIRGTTLNQTIKAAPFMVFLVVTRGVRPGSGVHRFPLPPLGWFGGTFVLFR